MQGIVSCRYENLYLVHVYTCTYVTLCQEFDFAGNECCASVTTRPDGSLNAPFIIVSIETLVDKENTATLTLLAINSQHPHRLVYCIHIAST